MHALLHARRKDEAGFTLVELMVVVLIIGILLAIAIPTFLGARSRSQDGVAKSSLRNAVTAAQVIYTDTEDYRDANAKEMAATEGSLDYSNGSKASKDPKVVSVQNRTPWGAAALSESGTCFYVSIDAAGEVKYGEGTGSCTGATAVKVATNSEF